MSFNPNNFYIGVIDLFAILLPGAIAALAIYFHYNVGIDAFLNLTGQQGFFSSFLLLFASYLFGHIISQASAYLDKLYDNLRKKKNETDTRLNLVKSIRRENYGNSEKDLSTVNTYDWSVYKLQQQAPNAAGEVERYTADSKFFRGLVLIASAIFIVFLGKGAWLLAVLSVLIALFSWVRYVRKRDKAKTTAYQYVIFLERLHVKQQ